MRSSNRDLAAVNRHLHSKAGQMHMVCEALKGLDNYLYGKEGTDLDYEQFKYHVKNIERNIDLVSNKDVLNFARFEMTRFKLDYIDKLGLENLEKFIKPLKEAASKAGRPNTDAEWDDVNAPDYQSTPDVYTINHLHREFVALCKDLENNDINISNSPEVRAALSAGGKDPEQFSQALIDATRTLDPIIQQSLDAESSISKESPKEASKQKRSAKVLRKRADSKPFEPQTESQTAPVIRQTSNVGLFASSRSAPADLQPLQGVITISELLDIRELDPRDPTAIIKLDAITKLVEGVHTSSFNIGKEPSVIPHEKPSLAVTTKGKQQAKEKADAENRIIDEKNQKNAAKRNAENECGTRIRALKDLRQDTQKRIDPAKLDREIPEARRMVIEEYKAKIRGLYDDNALDDVANQYAEKNPRIIENRAKYNLMARQFNNAMQGKSINDVVSTLVLDSNATGKAKNSAVKEVIAKAPLVYGCCEENAADKTPFVIERENAKARDKLPSEYAITLPGSLPVISEQEDMTLIRLLELPIKDIFADNANIKQLRQLLDDDGVRSFFDSIKKSKKIDVQNLMSVLTKLTDPANDNIDLSTIKNKSLRSVYMLAMNESIDKQAADKQSDSEEVVSFFERDHKSNVHTESKLLTGSKAVRSLIDCAPDLHKLVEKALVLEDAYNNEMHTARSAGHLKTDASNSFIAVIPSTDPQKQSARPSSPSLRSSQSE